MSTAIEKIVDRFPFPMIPPIFGTPTYHTISEVNLKLNSNAASVQSNLCYGTLVLLQLTVSPVLYNTLSVSTSVVPINPGSSSKILANCTGAQLTKICYAFGTAAALFSEYYRSDKDLRQILLTTVEEMFIRSLRHK